MHGTLDAVPQPQPQVCGTGAIWTDEEINDLKRLHAEGHSAGATARIVHKTRNAVIGKWFRLGLKRGGKGGRPKGVRFYRTWTVERENELTGHVNDGLNSVEIANLMGLSADAIRQRARKLGLKIFYHKTRRAPLREMFNVSRELQDLPLDESAFAVSFMDMGVRQCKWPMSEHMMFCGAERFELRPYCPRHCLRAYERPR